MKRIVVEAACRPLFEVLENRTLRSATIAVANLNNSGVGSLRDAIAAAAAGDTFDLTGLTGTLTLTSELAIGQDLTISDTDGGVTISGGNATRAFHIASGHDVSISGLTITDAGTPGNFGGAIYATGDSNDRTTSSLTLDHVTLTDNVAEERGGAIYVAHGGLTMTDCTVTGNHCSADQDAFGGAMEVDDADLSLNGCTFANNSVSARSVDPLAMGHDTGVASGGAIYSSGLFTASIVNCTFTGNDSAVLAGANAVSTARADGGAMHLYANEGVVMNDCTVTGNTVTADPHSSAVNFGAGVVVDDAFGNMSSFSIRNTIVAGNVAPAQADVDSSVPTTGDHNLIGDGDGVTLTDGTDGNLVGTTASPIDPMLAPLADNGGATPTMFPLNGSPVVDAGSTIAAATDQRGVVRSGVSDIGAVEVPAPPVSGPVTLHIGELVIDGTDDADEIHVFSPSGRDDILRVIRDGRVWNFAEADVVTVAIDGGAGDDLITANFAAGAYVYGGDGDDAIAGGDGPDTLAGGMGNDTLDGGAGDDLLSGHGGNDRLSGGDGDDRLYGNAGRDRLVGGDGNDRLDGGAGRDALFSRDTFRDSLFGDADDTAFLDGADLHTGVTTFAY